MRPVEFQLKNGQWEWREVGTAQWTAVSDRHVRAALYELKRVNGNGAGQTFTKNDGTRVPRSWVLDRARELKRDAESGQWSAGARPPAWPAALDWDDWSKTFGEAYIDDPGRFEAEKNAIIDRALRGGYGPEQQALSEADIGRAMRAVPDWVPNGEREAYIRLSPSERDTMLAAARAGDYD